MRKNITVEFTNERIIPSGGLAVVDTILTTQNGFAKGIIWKQRSDYGRENICNTVVDADV